MNATVRFVMISAGCCITAATYTPATTVDLAGSPAHAGNMATYVVRRASSLVYPFVR